MVANSSCEHRIRDIVTSLGLNPKQVVETTPHVSIDPRGFIVLDNPGLYCSF